MMNNNIKNGILALTIDGSTIKFASTTSISQDNPQELVVLKDMQGDGDISYLTNNQAPSTADFTLQNLKTDEFDVLTSIWQSNSGVEKKQFDLVFTFVDGSSIRYLKPKIKKQPMRASVSEGEESFNVMLNIVCNKIEEVGI